MAKKPVGSFYKEEALLSIRKANSLLFKVIKMAEDNKYCIDIMQQTLAAIGLLKHANQKLMAGHLNSCFKKAVTSGNKAQQQRMIEEILQVTRLSNK